MGWMRGRPRPRLGVGALAGVGVGSLALRMGADFMSAQRLAGLGAVH